ncbi:YihY/virulence factor BrkB family protein [Phyllobacterium endophyticum]|uniref:Ribonuclease n=1 Tax=Phyllobacterium endophyticum TaxID=1149773 RepID=A0A2P7AX78_9HYPH|nr:YihY/virulence factor BrkB family protein [Phyllobacterium endophyticum]MBB3234872.1 membrane protein [Phyllobacterium endophyticum]PSH58811.1 ribonuclease [Phyllobacterium endophyticum]TYR38979.1 YihY/virulence factor BrkB family protein [Phyllobacterium endophyticum]
MTTSETNGYSEQDRTGADPRGRKAHAPSEMPAKGWKDILYRVYLSVQQDRVTLIAAGASFYLLLALFPGLAAFVSIYGFFADRASVAANMSSLAGVLPDDSINLIRTQLESLATQDTKALSVSFVVGLAIALWSANNGSKAIFEALNVAYGETEKRSFIKLNLVSLAFTLGVMLAGAILLSVLAGLPPLLDRMGAGGWLTTSIRILRWPVMLLLVGAGISIAYRIGPDREAAQWRWVSWGAAFAILAWVIASAAFTFYLSNFSDYNATYGALGAVAGLMIWMWISVTILILGAELNAELEHQTTVDTTTGRARPMGHRSAVVADTLGESSD